MDKKDRPTV